MTRAARWAPSPRMRRANISSRASSRTNIAIESLRRANEAITHGRFDKEIVAGHGRHPQGRSHGRRRRAAGQGQSREDPAAQGRLRQGRHDHRGDLIFDQRRCRGAGADAPERRRQARQDSRSRASSHTPRTRRSRRSSRPRRSPRSRRCSRRPAGASTTSTCSRSTRRSPASR